MPHASAALRTQHSGRTTRAQRSDLYQRELLLDTILRGSPMAVVLANPADRVVFANVAARDLLGGGRRFEGRRFAEVVAELPAEMRETLEGGEESIFTSRRDDTTRPSASSAGSSTSTPSGTR